MLPPQAINPLSPLPCSTLGVPEVPKSLLGWWKTGSSIALRSGGDPRQNHGVMGKGLHRQAKSWDLSGLGDGNAALSEGRSPSGRFKGVIVPKSHLKR